MITEYMGVRCKNCGLSIPVQRVCQGRIATMTSMSLLCNGCNERHNYDAQDQCRFRYDDVLPEVQLVLSPGSGPSPHLGFGHTL
jgi:hypothetical protein